MALRLPAAAAGAAAAGRDPLVDEVRLRPTFFEHWDTAVVDWTLVAQTEESELEVE